MQRNLIWSVKKRFPALEKNLSVDIAIIGGGITGISSAYYLNEAGYDAAVIEQDEVGSAASGASSGILYYGCGTNFLEAIDLFGKNNSNYLWSESEKTIASIKELTEKNNLDAGFRNPGAIMAAKTDEESHALEKEHESLKGIGIDSELYSASDIKKFYSGREFLSGLHFPECSQIHPAVFCASLAECFNLNVFENTKFLSLEKSGDEVLIKTEKAQLKAKKAIFCTNLNQINYYYPENFAVDLQWGDSWSKSKDWLPIVGEADENAYVAVAMGDQGVVMGFTAARKIQKLIEGKDDEFLQLTSCGRFKK